MFSIVFEGVIAYKKSATDIEKLSEFSLGSYTLC